VKTVSWGNQERRQAHLPNLELIRIVVRITVNALQTKMNENRNQLACGKVGLPPLFVSR
jgi:hypothetical protein